MFDDKTMVLGGLLLSDEHLSNDEFNRIADEVLKKARRIGNAAADDGEAKAKDTSGRNSHNFFDNNDLDER